MRYKKSYGKFLSEKGLCILPLVRGALMSELTWPIMFKFKSV